MLNNPRKRDKFRDVINESKKFIESYMFEENTKISLINIKDKKIEHPQMNRLMLQTKVTFLKEEIKMNEQQL